MLRYHVATPTTTLLRSSILACSLFLVIMLRISLRAFASTHAGTALQAYESALRSHHAELLRAVARGIQVPAQRAQRGPDGTPGGRAEAAADLPILRAAAAARQHAVLAALAAARHASGLIAQQARPVAASAERGRLGITCSGRYHVLFIASTSSQGTTCTH